MMRAVLIGLIALACAWSGQAAAEEPERVTFPSADGKTTLVGYLFLPKVTQTRRVPAVVMMHGRAGAYSSLAHGLYDASTLSKRHLMWGGLWADAGYIAVLVDGFGPRGYPQGFPRFSYQDRPAELNEVTVRPLDAYGALVYLLSRTDVAGDRIGLQGWSNGGSATLAAMSADAPGIRPLSPSASFRAALAFYPGCGLKGRFANSYHTDAPVLILHGTADEEVSAKTCGGLVQKAVAQGSNVEIRVYDGATHGFDDPGQKRQRVEANAVATKDAILRAKRFFARELEGKLQP